MSGPEAEGSAKAAEEREGFIPSRNRTASSILPPAAFLAPKRPSQQPRSPSSPKTPLSPSSPRSFETAGSPGDAISSLGQSSPLYNQAVDIESPRAPSPGPARSLAASTIDHFSVEGGSVQDHGQNARRRMGSKASREPLLDTRDDSEGKPEKAGPRQDVDGVTYVISAANRAADEKISSAAGRDREGELRSDAEDIDELPKRSQRNGGDPMFDVMERVQGGRMKMPDQSYVPNAGKAQKLLGMGSMPASSSFSGTKPNASKNDGSALDLEKGHGTGNATSQSNGKGGLIKSKERNYKRHRGGNRFFLAGLLMTSQANPLPFLASLLLALVIPGLWFGFDASYVVHNINIAPVVVLGYTVAVSISSMLVTAWRDPGVVPRDLDPDPPCTAGDSLGRLDPEDPLAVPLPRVIRVRGARDIKVKWCETCGTYRPPRSSHCRMCDNCVENIDHHCTFLNTCIGRRNYTSFFAFLIFTLLSCSIMIAFSILHLYYLTRPVTQSLPKSGAYGSGLNFREALGRSPISAVMVILNAAVMPPIGLLLGYHVRLVSRNRTTVEQIRINTAREYGENPADAGGDEEKRCLFLPGFGGNRYDPNPFSFGSCFRNIIAVLGRPVSESWIARYERALEDKRSANPAFTAPAATETIEMQQR